MSSEEVIRPECYHAGNMAPPNVERYHFLRSASELFFRTTGGLAVEGLGNLPQDGRAFMITPNHESWMDVPALGVSAWKARIYLRMLAKTDLWDLKLVGSMFGKFLEGSGAVPTERKGSISSVEVTDRMDPLVLAKAAIVNFVQKSRKNHKLYEVGDEVSNGAALLAMRYGLQIHTAGIAGTREKNHASVSYSPGIIVEKRDFDLADRRSITRPIIEEAREITDAIRQGIRTDIAIARQNRH